MRARYYEPTSGRFVSQDPRQSRINWYLYANNNPILNVDQSGGADEVNYPSIGGISFSSAAFLAVIWAGLVSIPFLPNPFLELAMDDFNGFRVPDRWQAILNERLSSMALNLANGIGLGSILMDWTRTAQIGSGQLMLRSSVLGVGAYVLAVVMAMNIQYVIALVSCEMAFEDGL